MKFGPSLISSKGQSKAFRQLRNHNSDEWTSVCFPSITLSVSWNDVTDHHIGLENIQNSIQKSSNPKKSGHIWNILSNSLWQQGIATSKLKFNNHVTNMLAKVFSKTSANLLSSLYYWGYLVVTSKEEYWINVKPFFHLIQSQAHHQVSSTCGYWKMF